MRHTLTHSTGTHETHWGSSVHCSKYRYRIPRHVCKLGTFSNSTGMEVLGLVGNWPIQIHCQLNKIVSKALHDICKWSLLTTLVSISYTTVLPFLDHSIPACLCSRWPHDQAASLEKYGDIIMLL